MNQKLIPILILGLMSSPAAFAQTRIYGQSNEATACPVVPPPPATGSCSSGANRINWASCSGIVFQSGANGSRTANNSVANDAAGYSGGGTALCQNGTWVYDGIGFCNTDGFVQPVDPPAPPPPPPASRTTCDVPQGTHNWSNETGTVICIGAPTVTTIGVGESHTFSSTSGGTGSYTYRCLTGVPDPFITTPLGSQPCN